MKLLERARAISPSFVYRILQMPNNTVLNDRAFLDTYWQLVREGRMILTIREAHNIYHYLAEACEMGGAVAELGVYRGGGAKLMCTFKDGLPLHLFDTFAGMPQIDGSIDRHRTGDFSDANLESVKEYLSDFGSVHLHPGFFPDTTAELPAHIDFCFVHLDADIYESTLSGLQYFYPRLKTGGVLISHDYGAASCPGVRRAFDEFFAETDEDVVPLWDTQAMVKKRG
jgi:O-methyltransferase